jgi:TRAP-type C4-dicarboxylate transport system permease small subunit
MIGHLVLTAASQKRAAQIFNLLSMIAVVLMPAFPIFLIWGAASIMVYAASAHHPNPVVREYIRFAGYRFYGLAGTLLVLLTFSNELKRFLGGALHMWLAVWILSFLIVVPLGLRDVWRASRENWQDMALEAI